MATVTMPQLGESVTEGTILRWFKHPGDPVALDDPLCEIETEKVTAELPSEFAGTMGRLLVAEGATVTVGTALCEVLEAGSPTVAPAAVESGWTGGPMAIPPEPVAGPVPVAARPAAAKQAVASAGPVDMRRFYSPVAQRLAQEHGIDLAKLAGTGIGGRVTRNDVEAEVARLQATPSRPQPEARPAAPPATAPAVVTSDAYTVVQLSATRRTIAERLTKSNLEAPQAWTMIEVDVTALDRHRLAERERLERDGGPRLTLLPYFVRAVCLALAEHPVLNARWDGGELRGYHAVNAGIAVGTENGLVVPVIHSAQEFSVEGLAARIEDLATRARNRKLRLEDVEGGTITVNNTGAFGSIASRPLVNYPQVAIITLERVVKRPVVVDDGIAIRSMVNVCLSFDHRVTDGVEAGAFLAAVAKGLDGSG